MKCDLSHFTNNKSHFTIHTSSSPNLRRGSAALADHGNRGTDRNEHLAQKGLQESRRRFESSDRLNGMRNQICIGGPLAIIVALWAHLGCAGTLRSKSLSPMINATTNEDSVAILNTTVRYFRHRADQDVDSLIEVVNCRKFLLMKHPGIEDGHSDTVDCSTFKAYQEGVWRIGSRIIDAKGVPPIDAGDAPSGPDSASAPSKYDILSIEPFSAIVLVDSALIVRLIRGGRTGWQVVSVDNSE